MATRGWVETPANAIRTSPTSPRSADLAASVARRSASITSRAGSSRARPAGVSATDRVLRSNSVVPSSRSSSLMVRVTGGWAMCSRSAARRKWSSSATARKARSWVISIHSRYHQMSK